MNHRAQAAACARKAARILDGEYGPEDVAGRDIAWAIDLLMAAVNLLAGNELSREQAEEVENA